MYRSLETPRVALHWLSRLGASPLEPLQLAMGWSTDQALERVAGLEELGHVLRIAAPDAEESLFAITAAGARRVGREHASAVPPSWRLSIVYAWIAAWLALQDADWRGPGEVAADGSWRLRVARRGRLGRSHADLHRPDLGCQMFGRRVALEVVVDEEGLERADAAMGAYARVFAGGDDATAGEASFVAARFITDEAGLEARLRDRIAHHGLRPPPALVVRLGRLIEEVRALG